MSRYVSYGTNALARIFQKSQSRWNGRNISNESCVSERTYVGEGQDLMIIFFLRSLISSYTLLPELTAEGYGVILCRLIDPEVSKFNFSYCVKL